MSSKTSESKKISTPAEVTLPSSNRGMPKFYSTPIKALSKELFITPNTRKQQREEFHAMNAATAAQKGKEVRAEVEKSLMLQSASKPPTPPSLPKSKTPPAVQRSLKSLSHGTKIPTIKVPSYNITSPKVPSPTAGIELPESNLLKKLCSDLTSPDKGAFGCFISKNEFNKYINIFKSHYDVILQYPYEPDTKSIAYSKSRALLGKRFAHEERTITDEVKEDFLNKISSSDINGFKVLLAKKHSFNSFNREILRYRELLEDTTDRDLYAVRYIDDFVYKYKKGKRASIRDNQVNKDKDIKYISFSLKIKAGSRLLKDPKSKLRRIDFIFLQTCETNLFRLDVKKTVDFKEFITKMINDISTLHSLNTIHMDIKPENIMLCDGVYKLIDYGLSYNIPFLKDYIEHEQNDTSTDIFKKLFNHFLNTSTEKELSKLDNEKLNKYINTLLLHGTYSHFNPVMQVLFNRTWGENLDFKTIKQYIRGNYYIYILDIYNNGYTSTVSKYAITMDSIFTKFMSNYKQYKYIDYTNNSETLREIQPHELINFILNLYIRHDWYSLAITLIRKYTIFTFTDNINFARGIYKLVSLTDKELKSGRVDKIILTSFGLRSIKSRVRSNVKRILQR